MKKITPRQEIEQKLKLNGNNGYYGTHYQFILLIKERLFEQATKIMNSLNHGWLWSNERDVHNTIYNYLLDGISVKQIKNKFNNGDLN